MTFQTTVHPLNWKNPKDIYEISIDLSLSSKARIQTKSLENSDIKLNKFSKDIIFDSIENHNISEDTIFSLRKKGYNVISWTFKANH